MNATGPDPNVVAEVDHEPFKLGDGRGGSGDCGSRALRICVLSPYEDPSINVRNLVLH